MEKIHESVSIAEALRRKERLQEQIRLAIIEFQLATGLLVGGVELKLFSGPTTMTTEQIAASFTVVANVGLHRPFFP